MARSLSGARPLLAVLALALTLTVAPGAPASADRDPLAPRTTSAQHPDTPVLPRECATVEELIPQAPYFWPTVDKLLRGVR